MQTGSHAASRWFSYIGLGIGVLLLLVSVQMFVNIQNLLGGNVIHKNGYDFISITKKITNETMANPDMNVFTSPEIEELRKQKFLEGVAPLLANEFHVQLSAAGIFKTDLFLESLDNEFIDTVPPSFQWQEGEMTIPVIIGSDFLEAYNVFAPGQGLPQISQETAMSISVSITCFGKGKMQNFRGLIVAFSDRVNSVLVPQSFLLWANQNFGELKQAGPARLFLKTKDANDPDLLTYLEKKDYVVNREKTKFGREKRVIQTVFSGLGVLGLLVVIMALLLFSFYLQLVIARSKDSLQLLLLLGYSPSWLTRKLSKQFIPVYIFIVLLALGLTQLMQWAFHHLVMFDRPELQTTIHWYVLALALFLVVLSAVTNYSLVKRLLFKLK